MATQESTHPHKLNERAPSGEPDWESMAPAEFGDAMMEQLEHSGPILSYEDVDAIERRWEDERQLRRSVFLMLTLPGSELREKVANDRAFAVSVARALPCVTEGNLYYKGIVDLMGAASARILVALSSREDMAAVMQEADAEALSAA